MPSILVIEDETSLLDDLITILELENYDVVGTPRGQEGLSHAFQYRPDLIISDIKLPDITGLDLVHILKDDARTGSTPLVIITAHADPALQRACMAAGADHFLQKPFNVDEFLEIVRLALEGQDSR